jgi:hypothetical protein
MGCDVTSNMTSLVVLNLPARWRAARRNWCSLPRQGLRHLADAVGTRAGPHRHPEPAVRSRDHRDRDPLRRQMNDMGADIDLALS